ncbi:hypothetical protein [Methanohalobium sp.]|uniref:hypothetical protein n=1 Tax=Methanohalobium sp. TaxID=2837493 RepID=UPI0025F92647|nr:hypothetical protein [Methanohalobium sp.]
MYPTKYKESFKTVIEETDDFVIFDENNFDTTYHIIKTEGVANETLVSELRRVHKLLIVKHSTSKLNGFKAYYIFPKLFF